MESILGYLFLISVVAYKSFDSKSLNITEQEDIDLTRGENTHFVDFADMMTKQAANKNTKRFRNSIHRCPYSSSSSFTSANQSSLSNITERTKTEPLDKQADYFKLFTFDEKTIGLVSASQISFYSFAAQNTSLKLSIGLKKTFHLKNKIILDACADKARYVYILFSIENKIGKYQLIRGLYQLFRLRTLIEFDSEVKKRT